MTVLGIETATTVCGAALARDGEILASAAEVRKNIHAERLLPIIGEVLERAGGTTADIAGIAVSIGPGSFTGLRIGLSAAKGLAFALGIPIVGVPTLETLALRAAAVCPPGGWLLPVLDARREEVYCQIFRLNNGIPEAEGEVRDEITLALADRLTVRPLIITGEATDTLRQAWRADRLEGVTFLAEPLRQCDAGIVALRGAVELAAGRADDLASLEPRYVKEFFLKVR